MLLNIDDTNLTLFGSTFMENYYYDIDEVWTFDNGNEFYEKTNIFMGENDVEISDSIKFPDRFILSYNYINGNDVDGWQVIEIWDVATGNYINKFEVESKELALKLKAIPHSQLDSVLV